MRFPLRSHLALPAEAQPTDPVPDKGSGSAGGHVENQTCLEVCA
jgi:hypothetical protein